MTTLPLSEVKARLSEIAEDVANTHERVRITKNGREYVVLVAAEDLEAMEATLELLADPEAQARLQLAEAEVAAGDVSTSRPSGASSAARVVSGPGELPGRRGPERCPQARRAAARARRRRMR